MPSELETLLTEWSRKRDIEVMPRDEEGRHYLVFDGEHEVMLSQMGDSIYLESDLAQLPADRQGAEELLERLLRTQLARSGESVLSIADSGEHLSMFQVVRTSKATLNNFEDALGEFVNSLGLMSRSIVPQQRHQAPSMPASMQFIRG
ncbi:MAG: type III secretion system chaperone [Gammaproteobacteria bacterium]|nr:type III secretion system chaperone [Gammaproteobacteria bacterium]